MAASEARVILVRTAARGRSVVALQDFSPGDVVEASPVIVFSSSQSPAIEQTVLNQHPYRWVDGEPGTAGPPLDHWSVAGREDGALVLGLGTFINHSYEPNCEYRRDFADQRLDFIAIRAIERGEEVTVNYNGEPTSTDEMWFEVRDSPRVPVDRATVADRHVRTVVGHSPGRGRGVFAACDFRVGDVIERAPVIVLPKPDYYLLDERTVLEDYHFPWDRGADNGALVLGHGSLYNHSFSPNADYARDYDAEEIIFFAVRNIAAGEEIRWNYRNGSSSEGPMWFPLAEGDEP